MTLSIKSQRFPLNYTVTYDKPSKGVVGKLGSNQILTIDHGVPATVAISIPGGLDDIDSAMFTSEPLLTIESCNDLPISVFLDAANTTRRKRIAHCSGHEENCLTVPLHRAFGYDTVVIRIAE